MAQDTPLDFSPGEQDVAALCLRYLLQLRALALLGQVVVLTALHFATAVALPVLPLVAVIGAVASVTVFSALRLAGGRPVTQPMFIAQLMVDIVALATLVFLTGGSNNPMVSLFLLPVTVAAAALRPLWSWLLAGVTGSLYTALMFFHRPLPVWGHAHADFQLHLWGMWFGFLLSAVLVALFVTRIGAALRLRERALARAREQALEADQMLALGTLAAGTAHELGSPLATIAVIAQHLKHRCARQPELEQPLETLRRQVDRCKEILARLAADAGQAQALGGREAPVDEYLGAVLERWRDRHPDIPLDCLLTGPQPGPLILGDRTLEQAIANVLNNAAVMSRAPIEVRGDWDTRSVCLSVADSGPGLDPALGPSLGREPVAPRRDGGLGWGLYLARATLERLGGRLEILPGQRAGLTVRLHLPVLAHG